jgi:hypothetical protein
MEGQLGYLMSEYWKFGKLMLYDLVELLAIHKIDTLG